MRRLVPIVVALLFPVLAAGAPLKVGVSLGSRIRLRTNAASMEIRRDPLRLDLRERSGRRLVTTASNALFYERGDATHALTTVSAAERLLDGVRLIVDTDEGRSAILTVRFVTRRTLAVTLDPPDPATVQAAGANLRSPPSEHIYGLTERLRDSPPRSPGVIEAPIDDTQPVEVGSLDRRGEKVEMRILPTFSVYAPFYVSSRGYGLAVAGTTFGLFDLASADHPDTVSFRFETASAPAARRLVFHLFVGPAYPTILDEYTALNGRPFVPPDWAFLHWRWRGQLDSASSAFLDGVRVNGELAEDVLMYEQLGVPPGVYLFDRPVLHDDYEDDGGDDYGFARWAWDEKRIPNAEAMLASLRSRGYHLMTWSSMWTCGADPGDNGFDAASLGFHVPGSTGPPGHCADIGGTSFILDPTNPAAQAWWRDRIAAFMQTYGIRGIKLDRGEEHIPSEATDVYFDGRTGREVRNDYPRLQAKIHHDALQQAFPDGDFVLFSRPSYTGTSQWSIFWGGDIPGSELYGGGPGTDLGLRSAIISQQRCAFMGIPIWGSDTGGYYEFKDREVFARWIEFSTFSGIMEIGGVGAHAPWNMPTEPKHDDELIAIYRRYTRLRATLQPYIVAAAAGARTGLPIVRPMPFVSRRDAELADRWDQYLFGPDLLVAPVWKTGERRRDVYLPRGSWRSYWDRSQTYRGPRTISVDVPLDAIPVFVRGGATVPGP